MEVEVAAVGCVMRRARSLLRGAAPILYGIVPLCLLATYIRMLIPFQLGVVKKSVSIFLSRPGDVDAIGADSRANAIIHALKTKHAHRLSLVDYNWRKHAVLLADVPAQSSIVDTADVSILVVIFCSKLGSPLPEGVLSPPMGRKQWRSGTVYEYETALAASQRNERAAPKILVYRIEQRPDTHGSERQSDMDHIELLDYIQYEVERNGEGFCRRVENVDAFSVQFAQDLDNLLTVLGSEKPQTIHPEPWIGLRPYEEDDAPIFFGRSAEVQNIALRLRSCAHSERIPFLLIEGASGIGKSSLLRAGVLPYMMRTSTRPGGAKCCVLRFSSSPNGPYHGLVSELSKQIALPSGETIDSLVERCMRDVTGTELRSWIDRALEMDKEAIIFIGLDQLEEVLVELPKHGPGVFNTMFRALGVLVRSCPVQVICTLRTDLKQSCLSAVVELSRLVERGESYFLGPLTDEGLAAVVRDAAETAGLTFEVPSGAVEDLAATILKDASGFSAALPLVQFSLFRLWQRSLAAVHQEQGGLTILRASAFSPIGDALREFADERYAQLPQDLKEAFERMLFNLVTINDQDGKANRTWLRRPERDSAKEVVDALAGERTRLLVGETREDGSPVVALAHEILIEQWSVVKSFVESNRRLLPLLSSARRDAARWAQLDRREDELWNSAARVDGAKELLAANMHIDTIVTQEFLSRVLATNTLRARRIRRRKIAFSTGVIAAFVILTTTTLLALHFKRDSESGALESNQRTLTLAQALLEYKAPLSIHNRHDARLDDEVMSAMTQLLWSVKKNPGDSSSARLLYSALLTYFNINTNPPWFDEQGTCFPIDVIWSSDDRLAAVSTLSDLRIWDVWSDSDVKQRWLQNLPEGISWPCFSPDGKFLLGWLGDSIVALESRTWQFTSPPANADKWMATAVAAITSSQVNDDTLKYPSCWADSLCVRPLGEPHYWTNADLSCHTNKVAIASPLEARVHDATTWDTLASHLAWWEGVSGLKLSHDGRFLLTVAQYGRTRIWSIPDHPVTVGSSYQRFGKLKSITKEGCISHDDQYVALCSGNLVRLWNINSGELLERPLSHPGQVYSAAFSLSGDTLLTACADGVARLWEPLHGILLDSIALHSDWIVDARFNHKGDKVITSSWDKSVCIWTLNSRDTIRYSLPGQVNYSEFSPDDSLVLLCYGMEKVRVCNTHNGTAVCGDIPIDGYKPFARFSNDGEYLLVPGEENTVLIYTSQGQFVQSKQHSSSTGEHIVAANFSVDGRNVATASTSGKFLIWDFRTGELRATSDQDQTGISSVGFNHDGRFAFSASSSGVIRLWDSNAGVSVGLPIVLKGPVTWASFTHTGDKIIAVTVDGELLAWPVGYFNVGPPSSELIPWLEALLGQKPDEFGAFFPVDQHSRTWYAQHPPKGIDQWSKLIRWMVNPSLENQKTLLSN